MTAAIGLAVVGAGYWGPNLVRNAMATPSFRLRWLCDLDEERARRVLGPYSTVSTTGSFEALLDDDEVQAVLQSGALTSGVVGASTWQALSTDRSWVCSASSNLQGQVVVQAVVVLNIRKVGTTQNLLPVGATITLKGEANSG